LDLLVAEAVFVALKALKAMFEIHRGTGLRVCLLLNFGNPRLEIRRAVLSL